MPISINSITALTPKQLIELEFAKRLRANASKDLKDNTKYALVLMELGNGGESYSTLKAAIEAVPGIQEVSLLIDHQTKAVVPEFCTQVAGVRVDVHLREDTPEPE